MNLKKSTLICFVGMDGSGKTTQARRLAATLEVRGIKTKYVWNTYRPFLTWPFMALARVVFFHDKDAFKDYSGYSGTKKKLFRNRLLSWTYENLKLFDYLCRNLVTVRLPLALGRTVVSDRYVHDVVANLTVDLGYTKNKTSRMFHKQFPVFHRPDAVFLIDVPEEIGYRRKTDTPSVEFLKERRRVYLEIGRDCGSIVLDGSRSQDELGIEIERYVLP